MPNAKSVVKVACEQGLRARFAAAFVQKTMRFSSKIRIEKNGVGANAKSIMGILALAVSMGEEISVSAEGSDADLAVDALSKFLSLKESEEKQFRQ